MRKRGSGWFIASFLAPAVILYVWFVIIPLFQAFQLSAYRWRGVSPNRTFVGADNFRQLFADTIFWKSIQNNGLLLIGAGIATLALGVLLAKATLGSGRLAAGVRSFYLFPQIVSLVVVAILWQFLLHPTIGIINGFLEAVGQPRVTWLGQSSTALPSVGAALVWYLLGFYVLLFSAGLKQIPAEVGEAAELDGAAGWKRFFSIEWPMLWSVKRIATTYLTISVLNVFALVWVMTEGGPDSATEVALTYLYRQYDKNFQFGYATTIATVNFAIAMALGLGIMWYFRRDPSESKR